jgi:hypothetical protein
MDKKKIQGHWVEGYQAEVDIKSDPPKGTLLVKQPFEENPRKATLLEDMYKILDAQRKANEEIQACKKKRLEAAHRTNVKEAHYLRTVANDYPTKETRAAAAEELLDKDETYQKYKQDIAEIDEKLFTAKLDLEYLNGEWTILKVEANLMAAGDCGCGGNK